VPPAEVVVVGGGHNGLVCACYLEMSLDQPLALRPLPSLSGYRTR
jgi:thioredoxin reductase